MLCHCYRLTAAHEHSPQACTSLVPVPPREVSTTDAARPYVATRDGQPVELTLSEMSIQAMQEQVAEEQMWKERLRPQIERELRIRIAEEIEHDPTRGVEALRNLYVLGLANSANKQVLHTLDTIRLQVEHWLCGIRDGSVGRKT